MHNLFPAARAIDVCCLVERGVDAGHSRHIYYRIITEFFPDIRTNDNGSKPSVAYHKHHRFPAKSRYKLIDYAGIGEDIAEHHRQYNPRKEVWQIHRCLNEPLIPYVSALIQQHCKHNCQQCSNDDF